MKRITLLFGIAALTSLTTPGSASKTPKNLPPAVSALNPNPIGPGHVTFRRSHLPELHPF